MANKLFANFRSKSHFSASANELDSMNIKMSKMLHSKLRHLLAVIGHSKTRNVQNNGTTENPLSHGKTNMNRRKFKEKDPPTELSPDGQGPERDGWPPEHTKCTVFKAFMLPGEQKPQKLWKPGAGIHTGMPPDLTSSTNHTSNGRVH